MAVVGAGGILVPCIIILRAGNGGVRGAVVLQVERTIGDMLRGALLLAVVAGTQLLGLDLGSLLALTQLTQRVLLLFGDPAMHCGSRGLTAEAVATGVRLGSCDAWVSMRRQILVKLIDVNRLHVRDHVTAQLADIHCSKVDALLKGTALTFKVYLGGGQVSFGSCGRCWGALRLACS